MSASIKGKGLEELELPAQSPNLDPVHLARTLTHTSVLDLILAPVAELW